MKRFSRFEGFMQNYFENKAKHGPKLKNLSAIPETTFVYKLS